MKQVKIPGYRIIREIGRGGTAMVYLAIQENLDREVALKVLHPEITNSEEFRQRFVREGKSIAQLAHPHIVSIFDMGAVGYYYYIAMEYLPSGNLKDKMLAQHFSTDQKITVIKQMAIALEYAHSKGYVHRDVKPMNILFRDDSSAVLTDFGVAKLTTALAGATLTSIGFIVGTPKYMCPEQAQGNTIDARSDLYSIGVVFYELLTGKIPYDGDSAISILHQHIHTPIPKLPPSLFAYQAILDRLLAKQPTHRFVSMQAFMLALDGLALNNDSLVRPAVFVDPDETLLNTEHGRRHVLNTDERVTLEVAEPRSSAKFGWIASVILVCSMVAGVVYYAADLPRSLDNQTTIELLPVPTKVLAAVEPIDVAPTQSVAVASSVPPTLTPIIPTPPSVALADLLKVAESHLKAFRLTTPLNENAFDVYQTVLRRSPGHPIALKGLIRIADTYHVLARNAKQRGQLSKSLRLIKLGLKVMPEHTRLNKLKLQVQQSQTQHKTQQQAQQVLATQIQSLWDQAEAKLKQRQMTLPIGDNALELYEEILSLDPKHELTRSKMAGLMNEITQWVQQALPNGDVATRLNGVRQGLRLQADNTDLLVLQQTLLNQQRIDQYLTRAEAYFQTSRFTKPPQDSAWSNYQQVLVLDSQNKRALSGLARIAAKQVALATAAIEAQNYPFSMSLINEGLLVQPEHVELKRLQKEVELAIDTTNQQKTDQEQRRSRLLFGELF